MQATADCACTDGTSLTYLHPVEWLCCAAAAQRNAQLNYESAEAQSKCSGLHASDEHIGLTCMMLFTRLLESLRWS